MFFPGAEPQKGRTCAGAPWICRDQPWGGKWTCAIETHAFAASWPKTARTEQEGFEPPIPFGITVFKTVALSHSATAPNRPAGVSAGEPGAGIQADTDLTAPAGICKQIHLARQRSGGIVPNCVVGRFDRGNSWSAGAVSRNNSRIERSQNPCNA